MQSLFFLFFEHLVESRGLDALIRPNLYEERRRKKDRLDMFLEEMASNLYENADSQTREEYDESIEALKQSIK